MDKGMVIELFCTGAVACFYAVMLASHKSRRQKIREAAGEVVMETAAPAKTKTRAVLIAVPVVLWTAFMVNYSVLFVALVSAICALSVFIVLREDACNHNNGIYTKAIIGGGEIVPYEKIRSVLSATKEVPENLVLELEFVDSKKFSIPFASAEEYKTAAEMIARA